MISNDNLKDLLQARMTLQLSLFFQATMNNNEEEKCKTKAAINEIQAIASSFDISLSSSISGYYGDNEINIDFNSKDD